MKKCSKCQTVKSHSEFPKNKRKPDGYHFYCKSCSVEASRKYAMRRKLRSDESISADRDRLYPDGTKPCRTCENNLPFSNFGNKRDTCNGLSSDCKRCEANSNKAKRVSNKARTPEDVAKDVSRLRPDGVKQCRLCLRLKTLSEFYVHRKTPDGLTYECKKCICTYGTEKRGRARDSIIKTLSLWYGSSSCFKCSSVDGIEIDHVIPSVQGGEDSMSNYQLLCRGCNASKGGTYADYRPGLRLL